MEIKKMPASEKRIQGDSTLKNVLNAKQVNDVLKFIVSVGLAYNLTLSEHLNKDDKILPLTAALVCASALICQLIRNARLEKQYFKEKQR